MSNYQNETDENSDLTERNTSKDKMDVQFYFFYDLAKKLILKRNDVGDICTLSNWLDALEKNKNKSIKNDYIKLMLMALQHPEPTCPFKDYPPETIDPLENGVIEMMRKFKNRGGTAICVASEIESSNPPISTAVSNDKCQYASCQIIPRKGIQCYYAYSEEPMYNWSIPNQLSIPKDGPHARDVDWERAMAGIVLEAYTPNDKHLELNIIEKDDKTTLKTATSSKTFSRRSEKVKLNENSEVCKIMYIEQQNRNVTEEFEWNNASLLTGKIILGAEMGSDHKMDTQVSTQPEIDEDAVNAHKIIYPGDFKIIVDPSVVVDITPQKKFVAMETSDKKTEEPHNEKCINNHGPICNVSKSISKCNRPNAGQENIRFLEDFRSCPKEKDNRKKSISKTSADFGIIDEKYKQFKNQKNIESKCLKISESSTEENLNSEKFTSNINGHIQQYKDMSLLFQKNSLDYRRKIDKTEDNARFLYKDYGKSPKIKNKNNLSETDETSLV